MWKNLFNKVRASKTKKKVNPKFGKLTTGLYFNISLHEPCSFSFGENVHFRAFCNILVYSKGNLVIKDNVFFNNYCSINCLGDVKIGSGTIFGEGVKIYDHNHKYEFIDNLLKVHREEFSIGKVIIGNNCWIGSNVTILNNVEIGDNVIIGANNLIYKSIPQNSVVKSRVEQIIDAK